MPQKIQIRNIPDDTWLMLERLASRHDRALEAEARHALRFWVDKHTVNPNTNDRLVELSKRLRYALAQVNEVITTPIKPSQIAQAIGETGAANTIDWFAGNQEPTFDQLSAIANHLGVEAKWLQHDDRKIFPVEHIRIPEDAGEGVRWLIDHDAPNKPRFIRLIREDDDAGTLFIVKQYSDWHCTTYVTPYNISEHIGAGGEASLTYLSLIFDLLYKYYVTCRGQLIIKSYIVPPDRIRALTDGKIHPLAALKDIHDRPWWEDFWDESQFQRHDPHYYWHGWRQFCERIKSAQEYSSSLMEVKKKIRAGEHPLLRSRFNTPIEIGTLKKLEENTA